MKKLFRDKRLYVFLLIGLIVGIIAGGLYGQIGIPADFVGTNEWGQVVTKRQISFDIVRMVRGIFTSQGFTVIGFSLMITLGAYGIFRLMSDQNPLRDERGFDVSKMGTYGTSGWMNMSEFKTCLSLRSIADSDGIILGKMKGKIVSLPADTPLNRNIAIYGGPGSGKSRCFARSQIIQCVKREESIIVTDPKGELYADAYIYLKDHGYDVKTFNTKEPLYSDAWNCLNEISKGNEMELMAQMFADVIIQNTSEGQQQGNIFDQGAIALLKALCLYVISDPDEDNKTLGKVYEMLVNNNEAVLTQWFDALDMSHPAKAPWGIYKGGSDNLRGNIKNGLGVRLARAMDSPLIRKITGYDEINMESFGTTKSACFIITSDQDNVMGFLSTLFFTFLFIDLVRYADGPGHGKLPVPVNMILDEFPNIGQIPDFTKKISTVRSRGINIAVIFQNLAQLQNRYPNGLWEEIIGDCDTQLFLGCTDQLTAKYVSERTGEVTIDVNSIRLNKASIALTQSNPTYTETQSVGKRFLLLPDEVLRLDRKDALVFVKGQKPLKIQKLDISENPEGDKFEYSNFRDHIPEWKEKEDSEVEDDIIVREAELEEDAIEDEIIPAKTEAAPKMYTSQARDAVPKKKDSILNSF